MRIATTRTRLGNNASAMDGDIICKGGAGFFTVPHGLYVDNMEGRLDVYVTDVFKHQVFKFSAPSDPEARRTWCPLQTNGQNYKANLTLGVAETPGKDGLHFDKPTDVAVLPPSAAAVVRSLCTSRASSARGHTVACPEAGAIFVADGYGNSRVAVFSAEGKFLYEWGSYGTDPAQFDTPHSVTISPTTARVYVADRNNGRLQVFEYDGRFVAAWDLVQSMLPTLHSPQQLNSNEGQPWMGFVSAVHYFRAWRDGGDALLVVLGDQVVVLDALSGSLMGNFDGANGKLQFPHDVAVVPRPGKNNRLDQPLALFVSELRSHRVQRLWAINDAESCFS